MNDRVRVIKSKAVNVELSVPVDKVFLEEVLTFRMVEIDHRSPARVPVEVRVAGDPPKNIVVASRMIENHVEQHRQTVPVAGIDQMLQRIRATVIALDGVEIRRVVTPRVVRTDFVDRHQQDRRHTQVREVAR